VRDISIQPRGSALTHSLWRELLNDMAFMNLAGHVPFGGVTRGDS
jgi:hypothetical protein